MRRPYLIVLTCVAVLALCLSMGATSASAQITLGPTDGDPATGEGKGKFHVLGVVGPPQSPTVVRLLLGTCADTTPPNPPGCEFGGDASRGTPPISGSFLITHNPSSEIKLTFQSSSGDVDTFTVAAPVLDITYQEPPAPAAGQQTLIGKLTLAGTAKQLDLEPDGGRGDIIIEGTIQKKGGNIGGPVNTTFFNVKLTFSIGGNKEKIKDLPAGQTLSGGFLRPSPLTCICTL